MDNCTAKVGGMMSEESLYDKYGGFATVSTLVHKFYEKINATPDLEPYFENTDMERLIDHQTKFLCMVLGGPNEYKGRELKAAHKNLRITTPHFGIVADILQETLEEGGVEDKDVATIMGVVGGTKDDIVNESA